MPPRDQRPTTPDIRRTSRNDSRSNSISSSQDPSETEANNNNEIHSEHHDNSKPTHWTVLFPTIGMSILTWAVKTNARVRQQATACCCTGDFCVDADNVVGEPIPEEIVFQSKNKNASSLNDLSVTGTDANANPRDIELTTFEDSSVVGVDNIDNTNKTTQAYATSWTVPHPIRRTKWNELPEDPVDEVSLKGSSFYMSSSDDDDEQECNFHPKEKRTNCIRTTPLR
jgi:hypothetical protein